MKKRLSVCLLLVLFSSSLLFANVILGLVGAGLDVLTTQAYTTMEIDGEKVTIGGSSIRGLKKSIEKHDFALVDYSQRLALYEHAKVPVGWPISKNLLLGFGSGSKIQGDMGGKLVGEIFDWTTLTTMGVGASLYIIELFVLAPWAGSGGYTPGASELGKIANGFLIGGAIGFGVGRVVQAILPAIYSARHTKALREGLGINKDTSDAFALNVGAVPIIDESGTISLGMRVGARISL